MKNLIRETVLEVASLLHVKLINSDFVERNYQLIKSILKEKISRRGLFSKIISALILLKPILLALIHNLIHVINDDIKRIELSYFPISDETYKVMKITPYDTFRHAGRS